MNPKRHAELQRKLTLAQVPKPPADLLDRIKNDIPEYLRPEADRARLSRSVSFNVRVAAAVLVVISSVMATIYLLEPEDQLSKLAATAPAPTAAATRYPPNVQPKAEATDEVQVEISQQAPVMRLSHAAPPPAAAVPAAENSAGSGADQPSREEETRVAAGGVVGGSAAAFESIQEVTVADAAAPPAAPAAAPAPQSITVTAEAPVIERRAAKFAAPSLIQEAQAADLDLGPRASVFGISIDPKVFQHIKDTLEKNERPAASSVNVEAIINYFAGPPARKVRGVRLEVEGSPSPVDRPGQHGFLRFTIDTPSAEATLPVAVDAKLEIDLNGKAVEHAQPVGDSVVPGPESALLSNLSVTGLYELSLRPNLRAGQRVATVRLTYNDVKDGKRRTIEKTIYARDFGKLWTRASRRHRLASLGAVWGQSLKGASQAPEVARRAEELATQAPDDARAQELATAATASSKLNSSF